ncbi:hypothetical protein K0U83_06330 [bacterium]|nr:hypothetical protein [bacterium]
MSDLSPKQRYGLSIAALVTGATLLVMGGKAGDVTTQTAGGTIIAAVVGVLGYRAISTETGDRRQQKERRKK